MVRQALLGVVVVAVTIGLGCSDGEPSAEAMAEAERVADAALLTVEDLPDLEWQVGEYSWPESNADRNGFVQLADGEATPSAVWPEACGDREQLAAEGDPAPGILVTRAHTFWRSDADGVQVVLVSAIVFQHPEDAEAALERRAAFNRADARSALPCREAIAAVLGIDSFNFAIDELSDGIADSVAFRETTVYEAPGGVLRQVSDTHLFVRGRVMGSYVIVGGAEPPRGVDHQRLLELFVERVVAAQG